jgi:hypothetical protein
MHTDHHHASTTAPEGSTCCSGAGSCADKPVGARGATREDIRTLPIPELIRRLRRGVENFDRRIFELDDAQLDQAWLPDAGVGRWPARVLLGHLADAELVFVHRARRAYSEEGALVSLWDENASIDSGIYGVGGGASGAGSIGAFIAVIHTLRAWTAQWLSTLPDAAWERSVMHPERGPMSIRDIVTYDTWHLEHHARYLNAKVEKFLGPAPAMPKSGGGCGAGCGCKH